MWLRVFHSYLFALKFCVFFFFISAFYFIFHLFVLSLSVFWLGSSSFRWFHFCFFLSCFRFSFWHNNCYDYCWNNNGYIHFNNVLQQIKQFYCILLCDSFFFLFVGAFYDFHLCLFSFALLVRVLFVFQQLFVCLNFFNGLKVFKMGWCLMYESWIEAHRQETLNYNLESIRTQIQNWPFFEYSNQFLHAF